MRAGIRSDLIYTHVALGISFSGVLALRILWRLFGGLRRPVQLPTMNRIAADAAHYLLYLLLISQVTLGFLLG